MEDLDKFLLDRLKHEFEILDNIVSDTESIDAFKNTLKDGQNVLEIKQVKITSQSRAKDQKKKIDRLITEYTAEWNRLRLKELVP